MADLGRIDEALAGFARAIALMPAMAPAYFNRADVLLRIGRPDEALRDYDQHRAIRRWLWLIGRGIAGAGRLDEALASSIGASSIRLAEARQPRHVLKRWPRRRGQGEFQARAAELDPKFAALASEN